MSVVNSTAHHSLHQDVLKDGSVVYLQVSFLELSLADVLDEENIWFQFALCSQVPKDSEISGTLDLSMKKTRSPEFTNNHKVHNSSQPPSHLSSNSGSSACNNNKSGAPSHVPMMSISPHHTPLPYKQHPSVSSHDSSNNSYYHPTQVTFFFFRK